MHHGGAGSSTSGALTVPMGACGKGSPRLGVGTMADFRDEL